MIKNTENLAIRVGYICDKIVSNLMYIRSSSTSLYTGFHGMIKNKIRSFQICAQNLSTEFIPNLRVFKLKPLTLLTGKWLSKSLTKNARLPIGKSICFSIKIVQIIVTVFCEEFCYEKIQLS